MSNEIEKIDDGAGELQQVGDWEAYINNLRELMAKIRAATAETPPKYRRERDGPGGKVPYVTDEYLRGLIDDFFPDWSFMRLDSGIVGPPILPKPVAWFAGRLIITMPGVGGGAGLRRVFDDMGEHPVEFITARAGDEGNGAKPIFLISPVPGALKSAHTDCFKRCIRLALNAAHDIYRPKEEERNMTAADIENLKTLPEKLNAIWEDLTPTERMRMKSVVEIVKQALEQPEEADKTKVSPAVQLIETTIRTVERRKHAAT